MKRQEVLYLLLAVKSLSQNRKDKRYLLKVTSLDQQTNYQIQNSFEHAYQYVYKLWPCMDSHRQFVRIEMEERVEGELVKRGEASPMVRYSEEGDRYQFAGSRQEQCVLILKFRTSTLGEVEKQASSSQLERLKDRVEMQLIKNKHENEDYNNYLQYTNRVLHFLNNSQYMGPSQQQEEDKMSSISSTINLPENELNVTHQQTSLLGDFNNRMRESLQYLSNGKYFAHSSNYDKQPLPAICEDQQQEDTHQESLYPRPMVPSQQRPNQISSEIRKRRNMYTKPATESRKETTITSEAYFNLPNEVEPVSLKDIIFDNSTNNNNENQIQQHKPSQPQPSIIRTNDFPMCIKQVKLDVETSRRNARRRKTMDPESKEIKDSYSHALKNLEDVDLSKVFNQPRFKASPNIQAQVTIQLKQIKLHLFRGNFQFSKKLIVTLGKKKYQTLPAGMKNKQAEWSNHLVIPKCPACAVLHLKVVSVSEFSFEDEGEAKVLVNDFIRCRTESVKLYLNFNNIVVGFLDFKYKLESCDSSQQNAKNPTTFRMHHKERKSISLPQISKPNKEAERYRQSTEKDKKSGALSSHRKNNKVVQSRYETQKQQVSPDSSIDHPKGDKLTILSKAKQKKLKLRAKFK